MMNHTKDFLTLMGSANKQKYISAEEIFRFVDCGGNVPTRDLKIEVGTLISFKAKDKRNEQLMLYGYIDNIMTEPELDGKGEKKILMITMFDDEKKDKTFRIGATIGKDGNVYKISDGQQIHNIGPTAKYLLDYLNSEEARRRNEARRRRRIKRITVGEYEDLMNKIKKMEEMLQSHQKALYQIRIK